MRINNKMPTDSKNILDFLNFSNRTEPTKTTTMMALTTSSTLPTTSTTTTKTFLNNNEWLEKLSDAIEDIYEDTEIIVGALLVLISLISIIVAFKVFNLCKKGYRMHNEKIIRIHENTNPRL